MKKINRSLPVFLLCWLGSWAIIFADEGGTLRYAPADRVGFLIGEVVVTLFVGLLIWLTRHRKPIDHESNLPLKQPAIEAAAVCFYLVIVVSVGSVIGLRSHVASLGLTEHTLHVWEAQTPQSLLLWAGYYGLFGAFIPLLVFKVWRGYSFATLLLNFPEPKKWVPYVIVTGILGVGGFAGPAYFQTPLLGHLAALALFSLGTFLPVMILTQSLLAPRLAVLSRSWITGAVWTGVAYGVYHSGEFYLAWASLSEILISLAWLMQFAFFGFLKGVTTLRTGSAWIHIFNTHTPHLAEAPEIARILQMKSL